MKITIATLNDGRNVLAKDEDNAKTFSNRTQAQAAVDKLTAAGFKAFVSNRGGPVFYAALENDDRRYIVNEQTELGQVEIIDIEHTCCPAWSEEEVHDGLASAQATAAWSMTATDGTDEEMDKVVITQLPEGAWTAQDAKDRVDRARTGCLASFKVSREYLLALQKELRDFTSAIESAVRQLPS